MATDLHIHAFKDEITIDEAKRHFANHLDSKWYDPDHFFAFGPEMTVEELRELQERRKIEWDKVISTPNAFVVCNDTEAGYELVNKVLNNNLCY